MDAQATRILKCPDKAHRRLIPCRWQLSDATENRTKSRILMCSQICNNNGPSLSMLLLGPYSGTFPVVYKVRCTALSQVVLKGDRASPEVSLAIWRSSLVRAPIVLSRPTVAFACSSGMHRDSITLMGSMAFLWLLWSMALLAAALASWQRAGN